MSSWLLGSSIRRSAIALLVATLAWVVPAAAADISGTVDDLTYEGGRVYLRVQSAFGGEAPYGTSIDLGVTSDFTIRGVPDGDYVVVAFMDVAGTGLPLAWAPTGVSTQFQVATEDVVDVAVSVDYPEVVPPPGLVLQEDLEAIPADGAALLFWNVPRDEQSGLYLADSFTACWDTDPAFTAPTCYEGIQATDEEVQLVVDGLTGGETGTTYYFQITPSLDGTPAEPTIASTVIAPVAGGATVSGTVTFGNFTPPEGTPVYVAIYNDSEQNPQLFFGRFDAPAAGPLSFALPGVADGVYNVFTLADLNGNNLFDAGDAFLRDSAAPLVTVQGGDVGGVELLLNGDGAYADISTEHYKWVDHGDYYMVSMDVQGGTQRPVAVALTAGPDDPLGPVDIALSGWGGFNLWLPSSPVRPQVGDTYTFEVTYDDDSVGTVQGSVTGVLDSFPTLVSPKGLSLDATQPTFTWQAPANPPTPSYEYSFQLWSEGGGYMGIMNEWELPPEQTSISYTGEPLSLDTPYYWSVSIRDRNDNSAKMITTFTPVTQLPSTLSSNIGVFRAGKWYLDLDGTHSWTPPQDQILSFGQSGDLPFGVDLNGDGVQAIGIFRAGKWYVDANENGAWDGVAGGDELFTGFGMAGDIPVVADWNSGGGPEMAIFRAGKWYIDMNNSNSWDPAGGDQVFTFGMTNDIPVPADWDGDGEPEMAIFRAGKWYVDSDGSRNWTPGVDQVFTFGLAGDKPVVGDWDQSGIMKVGVFRAGKWYLDMDGNRAWNSQVDNIFYFGLSGDIPFTFVAAPSSPPE